MGRYQNSVVYSNNHAIFLGSLKTIPLLHVRLQPCKHWWLAAEYPYFQLNHTKCNNRLLILIVPGTVLGNLILIHKNEIFIWIKLGFKAGTIHKTEGADIERWNGNRRQKKQ